MRLVKKLLLIFGIKRIEMIFMPFLTFSLTRFEALLLMLLFVLTLCVTFLMLKVNFLSDMCTHGKFVTNKYTGVRFWCDCGKCKSCLQKKAAARSSRIRNEYDGITNIFFVTLTYDRLSAPYFEQDDFDNLRKEKSLYGTVYSPLNIYRRFSIKWIPSEQKYVKDWSRPFLQTSVNCDVPPISSLPGIARLYSQKCSFRWLEKQPKKIGVILFSDVQKFVKRLRQVLKRNYNYEEKIRVFNCTEYGPTTQRPHAHLLIHARNISQETLHNAVIKSWPFGRRIRNSKSCQLVTGDPAGYVSSYVNCHSYVPSFLAEYFPPQHSASKYYGHGREVFRLDKVQELVSKGDLRFDLKRVTNSGEQVIRVPIPKYVLNRLFPLFKGHSRLTSNQVHEFLSSGFDEGTLLKLALTRNQDLDPHYWIDYTVKSGVVPSDLHKIHVRLSHAFDYYKKFYPGASLFDYAKSYDAAWRVYRSTCYRSFIEDDSVNDFYKYDNIVTLPSDRQRSIHSRIGKGCVFIVDNNNKPQRINETIKMTDYYNRYDKQKKVSGLAMSQRGILV